MKNDKDQHNLLKRLITMGMMLALLVVAGTMNYHWVSNHTMMDGISEGDLVEKALTFAYNLEHGRYQSLYKFMINWEYPSDTPNLLFILGYASWQVFDRSYHSYLYMMTVVYLLLILGTFLVTRELGGNRPAALAAAALVSVYPMVYELSRTYCTYTLTTAIFCYTIILLLRTRNFTKLHYSIAFGLVLGINIIAERGTPPLFILGPLGFTLYQCVRQVKKSPEYRYTMLINFTSAAAVASIIALPYILGYIWMNFSHNLELINQDIFAPESIWYQSHFTFLYYIVELDRIQAGPTAGLLFFLMLPLVIKYRPEHSGVLFFWLLVPFIVFTLIAQKAETYTITWLPAVAAVSGMGLTRLRPKIIGLLIIIPVLALGTIRLYDNLTGYQFQTKIYRVEDRLILDWLMNKNNKVQPRPLRTGYYYADVAKVVANRYPKTTNTRTAVVNANPNPEYDDKMDMSFFMAIENPELCQILLQVEVFDHDTDQYLDTLVIAFDDLEEKGCPVPEWLVERFDQFCMYQFALVSDDNAFVLKDEMMNLPFKKVATYDLGHGLPMNLYEVDCH